MHEMNTKICNKYKLSYIYSKKEEEKVSMYRLCVLLAPSKCSTCFELFRIRSNVTTNVNIHCPSCVCVSIDERKTYIGSLLCVIC